MDGNADDFRHGVVGRTAVEEVFVPVADLPVRGGGGGEAGEGKSWGENVLAEAGVGILGVEGVDEKRVTGRDGGGAGRGVERRRVRHGGWNPPAERAHTVYFTI